MFTITALKQVRFHSIISKYYYKQMGVSLTAIYHTRRPIMKTIAIIDDDIHIGDMLTEVLTQEGYPATNFKINQEFDKM